VATMKGLAVAMRRGERKGWRETLEPSCIYTGSRAEFQKHTKRADELRLDYLLQVDFFVA